MTDLLDPTEAARAAEAQRRRGVFHTLTISSVEPVTDDASAIAFEVPEDLRGDYDFAAGQALTLRRTVDGEEQRRTYSICSPQGTAPRIGVREVPGGVFSRWLLHEVRPGDRIDVQTPSGSFRAHPDVPARHLCIAAGSGITPMLSIASTVLANPGSDVTLLYGNRTTGSVMFAEELADLKNRYGPRFDLVHVLSREPRDVELFSGRLEPDRLRALLTTLVPLAAVDHVWLCGPFDMVAAARDVLTELGVAPEKVHVELFFVDQPPPQLRHPEQVVAGATTEVTVVLDGRSTTLAAPQDKPVLDSAQASRPDLPFACKGGVCGTCRAKVTDGEVDMVRNYALDDSEVAQGFVLTCQSFPTGEHVTVDYDA